MKGEIKTTARNKSNPENTGIVILMLALTIIAMDVNKVELQ